jgi:hypothetical protein
VFRSVIQLGHLREQLVDRRLLRDRKFAQLAQPYGHGVAEPLFLEPDHPADEIPLHGELRKSSGKPLDHKVANLIKERILQPEVLASVIDGPTHYLAQHIVSPLIAGQNPVRDGERRSAGVVRDHAAGKLLRLGKLVVSAHIELNIISLKRFDA